MVVKVSTWSTCFAVIILILVQNFGVNSQRNESLDDGTVDKGNGEIKSDSASDRTDLILSNSTITPPSSTNSTLLVEHKKERVCRGTSFGLAHSDDEMTRYNLYKGRYTNCTYVDGNLELVFLQNHDYSFLQDIKEVGGYVLIVANSVDFIPLTNLMIIRGRTLFEYENKYFGLYVALNYDTNLTANVGLKELRLTSLHEILAGSVFIFENELLCFESTINWKDIITGEGAEVIISKNGVGRTCGQCHESCEFKGERHCWGAGPNYCQKFTKLSCSAQCDGRCFGSLPNQCCHGECAAGCTGTSKSQCWACKNFNDDGSCESFCPPETVYSAALYKNIPNPNAKYAFGALCVKNCPAHLIADHGACVQDCGAGRVDGKKGKCVDCDGPCPKICKIDLGSDFINSGNIHLYSGCTVVQGSIKILYSSLQPDPYRGLSALKVEQLSVLETIQEVTDFVQIQANNEDLRTLSFLKNLKTIHGRKLASDYSLQIFQTSIESLGLESLAKIVYGTIFIANNSRLCYVNSVKWETIRERENQRLYIAHNRNDSACLQDNEVCSAECTTGGCWGPHDYQCRSCANYHLGNRCVHSCESVVGVYTAGSNECRSCHAECKTNCTGKDSDKCDDCRNARDGPYCVAQCPSSKYRDENGVCQLCHPNCEDGCTGPRNMVGRQACNSCGLVEFSDDSEISSCLSPESNCSDGFYKQMLSGHYAVSSLAGKQACMKCHTECRTCIGDGISFCTSCKHFTQDGNCVAKCALDYYLDARTLTCMKCNPRCLNCTGPTAADCMVCKEFKVYIDFENRLTNPAFNCTHQCPEDFPHAVKDVSQGNEAQEMICASEDQHIRTRNIYIAVGSVAGGVVMLVMLFITIYLCCRCRHSTKNNQRLTEQMAHMKDCGEVVEPVCPSEVRPDMAHLRLITESELKRGLNIGSGAFGTVFMGLWCDSKRNNEMIEVAIKILKDGTTPSQTKELLEEARIMASVNHPCCTKILAVCLSQNVMLITKLLPRGCMLDYIRRTPGLGSETLLIWCKQIAEV